MARGGEDGRSRIAGFSDALRGCPDIALRHLPSAWRYEHAYPQIEAALRQHAGPIDAIFGLSDSLALASRDVARTLGILDPRTLIVGINGDPLMLAAIADGSVTGTIDTPAAEFGFQALDLACAASRSEPIPDHFGYSPRLVTTQNVTEIAMQKLVAMAEMPNRLVGVNREQEQQRIAQLEISLAISQRIGAILERETLAHEIADLIKVGYGYDFVQLFRWRSDVQLLALEHPGGPGSGFSPAEVPMLDHALRANEPVFVTNLRYSQRFAPDPRWPDTRSRVVVPIRQGSTIIGLIDLHSQQVMRHTRQALVGLQALADQLGVAIINAELYDDALRARASAEKADQLKTRLLANVSHELRAPLNVILGYSEAALDAPNPYGVELHPELLRDLRHIKGSGQYLSRLVNDLLDLSRAEIDALELFPEPIAIRAFLEELFQSVAEPRSPGPVEYQLRLPDTLPLIEGDPLRLRQILLNLLGNAQKFTTAGRVVLGAELAPPHLHIWVEDSGPGVPAELGESIFEPFVTGRHEDGRPTGVGLGLSISRRLAALHAGALTVESRPGEGSTFHLHLALPSVSGRPAGGAEPDAAILLLLGGGAAPPNAVVELCQRQGLTLCRLRRGDPLPTLAAGRPAAVAWDMEYTNSADWRLFEQLREGQHLSRTPLILLGAETEGAIGVAAKPFSGAGLLELIAALCPAPEAGPVLLVDDDPQTCELYARIVRQALPGSEVRIATGGVHALELLAEEAPGLIVLDLMMPEVDGFAVLERVRADTRTRQVPVVVISGQAVSLEDVQRLDHAMVVLHSKDVLSDEETGSVLRDALASCDRLPQPTSLLVKRALAHLQQEYASNLSRQQIALAVGVSENYLTEIFRRELGLTPWEYLTRYRIRQARELLQTAGASISAVAAQVGFDDASYFGRVFRRYVGCSPQAYRNRRAAS